MGSRRYIHQGQTDCPRCGHTLQRSPGSSTGDVEWRHCEWCDGHYCVAPRGISREVVESRWGEFLAELGEHAEQVREGEAGLQRLKDWCCQFADKACLPLHHAAIEAIAVAVTGDREASITVRKGAEDEQNTG